MTLGNQNGSKFEVPAVGDLYDDEGFLAGLGRTLIERIDERIAKK